MSPLTPVSAHEGRRARGSPPGPRFSSGPQCGVVEPHTEHTHLSSWWLNPTLNTLTFHHGQQLPHAQTPHRGELAQGGLQEEQRDPSEHQRQEVGDQEGSCHMTRQHTHTTIKAKPCIYLLIFNLYELLGELIRWVAKCRNKYMRGKHLHECVSFTLPRANRLLFFNSRQWSVNVLIRCHTQLLGPKLNIRSDWQNQWTFSPSPPLLARSQLL